MEHTKGKWEVQELEKDRHGYKGWNTYCVRSSKNVCLAVVGEVDRHHEKDNEANARLIAAAPALLEACEFALDAVEDSELYPQSATDKLAAAIAQAKG